MGDINWGDNDWEFHCKAGPSQGPSLGVSLFVFSVFLRNQEKTLQTVACLQFTWTVEAPDILIWQCI